MQKTVTERQTACFVCWTAERSVQQSTCKCEETRWNITQWWDIWVRYTCDKMPKDSEVMSIKEKKKQWCTFYTKMDAHTHVYTHTWARTHTRFCVFLETWFYCVALAVLDLLCKLGWPQTQRSDASACQVLRLNTCATTTWQYTSIFKNSCNSKHIF